MSAALFAHREGAWSLDELVEHANGLLPDVLPKGASGRTAEAVNQRLVRHYATQGLVDEPLKEGREARYLYRHLLQLLVLRRLLAEGLSSALAGRVMEGRSDAELEGLLAGDLSVRLVPDRAPGDERTEFLRRVRLRAGLGAGPGAAASPAGPAAPVRPPSAGVTAGAAGPAAQPPPTAPAASFPPPPPGSAPFAAATTGAATPGPARAPAAVAGAPPLRESAWTRLEVTEGLELMVRDDFRLPATRLGDDELVQLLKVALLHLEQKRRGTT